MFSGRNRNPSPTLLCDSIGYFTLVFHIINATVGGDAWYYGLLATMYGITQLIGSPIMGKISDTHGRKRVLLISFVGSGIGYFTVIFARIFREFSARHGEFADDVVFE
jgi:MFS family permease